MLGREEILQVMMHPWFYLIFTGSFEFLFLISLCPVAVFATWVHLGDRVVYNENN